MTLLANETCTACHPGAARVPATESEQLLQQLPGWKCTSVDGVERLSKSYDFKNFAQALAFANAVGELAEGVNHHPELRVEWGRATVSWWTHSIRGLHRNDYILAAKTDALRSQ